MSIVVESVSTKTFATGSPVTINKPTGLSVGDLMIAHITCGGLAGSAITPPAEWAILTELRETNDGGSGGAQNVFWKIADADDVAASNFSFTHNYGSVSSGGAILRISGYHPTSPINVEQHDSGALNTTNPNINYQLTPTYPNSLFIFFIMSVTDADTSENYTIANSNPTWTEQYDFVDVADFIQMACATAIRPETTVSGNWSFNCGSAETVDSGLHAVIIKPRVDIEVTPNAVTSSGAIASPTVTGGATFTVNPVTASSTINSPNVGQAKWSAQEKSSAPTWTAQSKS